MATQLQLDFEPGLIDQFKTLDDLIRAVVYSSRIGLSGVAAELDYSPSGLSRILNSNPDDPRHFPLSKLDALIAATGDFRPIYWLAEKYLKDEKTKHREAIARLQAILPELERFAANS